MNRDVKLNLMMFTDADLDGIGCAVAIKELTKNYPDVKVDIKFSGRKIYKEFQEFLDNKEYDKYDFIFVTDLSISKEQAETVLRTVSADPSTKGLFKKKRMLSEKIIILDHHNTALWLNEYPFANVIIDYEGENGIEPTSGTLLTYMYLNTIFSDTFFGEPLLQDFYENEKLALEAFVYMVRDYDTWRWRANNDLVPKRFNDWFLDGGIPRIMDLYKGLLLELANNQQEYIKDGRIISLPSFIENELKYIDAKIEEYINKALKRMTTIDTQYGRIGIMFAEQYTSELGNKASELNPDLKFIAMYNGDRFSLRTIRDDIKLGTDVAKHQASNGGGIDKAAGFSIDSNIIEEALKMLFNNKLPEPKVITKEVIKEVPHQVIRKEDVPQIKVPEPDFDEMKKTTDRMIKQPYLTEPELGPSVMNIETTNDEFRKLIEDQIANKRKNRSSQSMGIMAAAEDIKEENVPSFVDSNKIKENQHTNADYYIAHPENARKRFKHGFSITDLIEADEEEKRKLKK